MYFQQELAVLEILGKTKASFESFTVEHGRWFDNDK